MQRSARALLPLLLTACPAGSGGIDTTDGPASSTGGTSTGVATESATGSTTDSAPTSAPTDSGVTGTSTGTSSPDTTSNNTTDGTATSDSTGTGESASGTTGPGSSSSSSSSTGQPGECTPGDVEDCYSGPAETLGVGQCAAGQRSCDGGGLWGACAGEVLPAAESCDSVGDEDCDGADPCNGDGGFVWSKTFGAALDESGMRVAFDGAGNLVLAAQGKSTIDFGGGPLIAAGGTDLFLARFAPDGKHLWSKRFGDAANQFNDGFALAVDAAGEIALAGDFEGTIDFGGGPMVAKNVGDPFLARFTSDGGHVWSKAFKTGSYAYPQAVAFDPAGHILLGGYFFVSLDLGGGVMNSAGMVDAFIGKFDADGVHQWSQRFGDANGQYVLGLVTDAASNVYAGGGFQGTLNLGNGPLVSAGNADVFLARFEANGNPVWSKRFGDAQNQVLRDLAIDGKGRLSFGGEMQGSTDFGGGPIGGNSRGFIAQFDGAGKHLWSHAASDGQAQVKGVAVDGLGSVLLTGEFSGASDFGGGALVSEGSSDLFLVKLGPAGQHVWSKRFGDFAGQFGLDTAGSAAGFVAVTGNFNGGINFGGGPINSKGLTDGLVVVFEP